MQFSELFWGRERLLQNSCGCLNPNSDRHFSQPNQAREEANGNLQPKACGQADFSLAQKKAGQCAPGKARVEPAVCPSVMNSAGVKKPSRA